MGVKIASSGGQICKILHYNCHHKPFKISPGLASKLKVSDCSVNFLQNKAALLKKKLNLSLSHKQNQTPITHTRNPPILVSKWVPTHLPTPIQNSCRVTPDTHPMTKRGRVESPAYM